jgi:hypothetical protein
LYSCKMLTVGIKNSHHKMRNVWSNAYVSDLVIPHCMHTSKYAIHNEQIFLSLFKKRNKQIWINK